MKEGEYNRQDKVSGVSAGGGLQTFLSPIGGGGRGGIISGETGGVGKIFETQMKMYPTSPYPPDNK